MIKKLILLIFLCSPVGLALSGQPDLDSLYAKRDTARHLRDAINTTLTISRQLLKQDPDSAQELNIWCEKMAMQTGDSALLALAYEEQGAYYQLENRFERAVEQYAKALVLFKALGDVHRQGVAYNSLAVCHRLLGHYDRSIDLSLKSVEAHQKANDSRGVAAAYNNIAIVHYYQGNVNKTLSFFKQALETYEAAGDTTNAAKLMANIGIIYKNKGDFDTALEYYRKTADYMKRKNNYPGMARIYHNTGALYQKMNQPAKALEYMNKSLGIWRNLDNKRGLAEGYLGLSSFYQSQNQYDLAIAMARKGLRITKAIKLRESEQEAYKALSSCLQLQGNYKDALQYYMAYSELKDSLYNEENAKNIAKMQAQFEADQKEKENELLRQQDALNKVKIEKQESEIGRKTLQTWMAAGGAIALLFLVLFVLRSNRHKQLVNRMLADKNKIIAEKNRDITASIQYARRIQSAILPPQRLVKEFLRDSFILYKPKDIVAGDFYWMETINSPPAKGEYPKGEGVISPAKGEYPKGEGRAAPLEGRKEVLPRGEDLGGAILFAVADCTGHGVPGAMVSVVCHNALNRAVREFCLTEPGEILNKTRDLVLAEFEKSEDDVRDGMDISLALLTGGASRERWMLKWAGANNPLWIINPSRSSWPEDAVPIISEEGNPEGGEWKADKQPIGKYVAAAPFTTHDIALVPGDTIYLFSDGYADQFGGINGKKFMYKPLKKLLCSINGLPMEEQRKRLEEDFESWKGSMDQIDDVCIMGVRL